MCQTSPTLQNILRLSNFVFQVFAKRTNFGSRVECNQFLFFRRGADADQLLSQSLVVINTAAELLQDIHRVSLQVCVHLIIAVRRRIGIQQLGHHVFDLVSTLTLPISHLPMNPQQSSCSQSIRVVLVPVKIDQWAENAGIRFWQCTLAKVGRDAFQFAKDQGGIDSGTWMVVACRNFVHLVKQCIPHDLSHLGTSAPLSADEAIIHSPHQGSHGLGRTWLCHLGRKVKIEKRTYAAHVICTDGATGAVRLCQTDNTLDPAFIDVLGLLIDEGRVQGDDIVLARRIPTVFLRRQCHRANANYRDDEERNQQNSPWRFRGWFMGQNPNPLGFSLTQWEIVSDTRIQWLKAHSFSPLRS